MRPSRFHAPCETPRLTGGLARASLFISVGLFWGWLGGFAGLFCFLGVFFLPLLSARTFDGCRRKGSVKKPACAERFRGAEGSALLPVLVPGRTRWLRAGGQAWDPRSRLPLPHSPRGNKHKAVQPSRGNPTPGARGEQSPAGRPSRLQGPDLLTSVKTRTFTIKAVLKQNFQGNHCKRCLEDSSPQLLLAGEDHLNWETDTQETLPQCETNP